jgi:hypothetical protein
MKSKEELVLNQYWEFKEIKQKEIEFDTSKSTDGNKDTMTIHDSTKYLKPSEISKIIINRNKLQRSMKKTVRRETSNKFRPNMKKLSTNKVLKPCMSHSKFSKINLMKGIAGNSLKNKSEVLTAQIENKTLTYQSIVIIYFRREIQGKGYINLERTNHEQGPQNE